MAHNITSRDGLVLAGAPAWHGLEVVLPEAPTVDEALDAARLRWQVVQRPLFARMTAEGDPALYDSVPTHVANVRSDTGEVLGVVSAGYTPVQNEQVAGLILGAAASGAIPRVESAGSLRAGRDVFFNVRVGSFGLGLGNEDRSDVYAIFANNHDGRRALRVYTASVRVVCNNTLVSSGVDDISRGLSIRHTSGIAARVEEIREALNGVEQRAAQMQRDAQALADRPLSQDEIRQFFLKVEEELYGPIKVSDDQNSDEQRRRQKNAVKRVSQWLANMESPKQTVGGLQGTAWSAVNAVTEWLQHDKAVAVRGKMSEQAKASARADSRLHSNLFASAADQTRQVHEIALALV